MSKRLWDKGGVSDAEMMGYTARDDWQLDQRLLGYDLRATPLWLRIPTPTTATLTMSSECWISSVPSWR